MRDVGVFAGGLRVALRFRRCFVTLGVFAFAMMFGGGPMALGGAFVMFRRLGMSFLRHSIFPLFECRCQVNSVSLVIVPAPAPDPSANTLLRARRAAGPLEHRQRERVGRAGKPGQREEEPDAWLGDGVFYRYPDRRRSRLRNRLRNGFRRREDHIRTGLACIPHFGRCRGRSARSAVGCISQTAVRPRKTWRCQRNKKARCRFGEAGDVNYECGTRDQI